MSKETERLTDNEFHSKDNKERACYIQEPRLQAIYDKCFEYEDIDTDPKHLANVKRAFEIIKNKNAHISLIKNCENVEQYNRDLLVYMNKTYAKKYYLTNEQFGLLKEMLL